MNVDFTFESELFPYAQDKAIVDLIQSISVASHHIDTGKQNSSINKRFLDGLSGKTQKRSLQIQENLVYGLEGCRQWLTEISGYTAQHATAIIQLQKVFQAHQLQFETLIDCTIEYKQLLNELKQQTTNMFVSLEKRIDKLELNYAADKQVNLLFDQWDAGKFNHLSAIQKIYLVSENLYWGAFGERSRSQYSSQALDNLKDKLVIRLKNIFPQKDNVILSDWMYFPKQNMYESTQASIQYMGDWCWQNPQTYPLTFMATQWHELNESQLEQFKQLSFAIRPITKVTDQLVNEVLQERVA